MNKGTIQTVGNMFTLSAGDDIGSKTQCLSYDAKNRPASFRDVSTGTLVECAYDYRGRRCTKKVTVAGTATRPLTFRHAEKSLMLFYAFDGNKNVSDLFFFALQNGIGAHYEYAPFGAIVRTSKATSSKVDLIGANPWRFSSEFYDSELDGQVAFPRPHRGTRRKEPLRLRRESYWEQRGHSREVESLGMHQKMPWF